MIFPSSEQLPAETGSSQILQTDSLNKFDLALEDQA